MTFDRPDLGNALTNAAAQQLGEVVDEIAADPSVRVLVLTGNGKMFCAGGDIREFTLAADRLPDLIADGLIPLNRMLVKLAALPIPVITALNGPVAGGGIGLALTADVVIAARDRDEVVVAEMDRSVHLTRLIGPQRAKEFLFTNRFIDAPEALAIGLVAKVVPDEELASETAALARTIASLPAGSHAAAKALVNAAVDTPHADVLALERTRIVENAASADSREGIRAFMERRRPAFAS